MYHPQKHGVLDHAFLSVFLRVGGKSGRAEGTWGTDLRIYYDAENESSI